MNQDSETRKTTRDSEETLLAASFSDIWRYKPWWCQPWSIILTGLTIIFSSWLLWHILWLSLLVAVPIIIWWVYFLLLYPRMFKG